MDRRAILRLAPPTLLLSAMIGCDSDSPSRTACLFKNQSIKEAMDELEGTIDNIESRCGDFHDENWRDVVPDVKDLVDELVAKFVDLREILG